MADATPVPLTFEPPSADPDRLAFLAGRCRGIGGSDVGSILGVNPWKSAFQVWQDKVSPPDDFPPPNERMHWGTVLEDSVAREFGRRMCRTVEPGLGQISHPDYPFLIANIDRLTESSCGGGSILEVKTASAFVLQHWEREGVPMQYLAQVMHYMAMSCIHDAYLACLFGGQEMRVWHIDWVHETADYIMERCIRFWNDHVLAKVPPEVDAAALEWLAKKHPRGLSDGDDIPSLGDDLAKVAAEYADLSARIKGLEKARDDAKAKLQKAMGDRAEAVAGEFHLSWKNNKDSITYNTARLLAEWPEAAKAVAETKPGARVFKVTTDT